MSDEEPVAALLERLRGGDQRAAAELFHRYAQRLSRLAEQRLSRRLAGRVDGEDVVQSVFRTFFRRSARGDFRIDTSAQLWRLLLKITLVKVCGQARRHQAGRRDAGAEAADDGWLAEAAAREPGPEDAAVLTDQIEALLRGLPPAYCQLLELRLQGHGVSDIAQQLGVVRQTVHRMLNVLQERLTAGAEGGSS
jgi:RNA polymerase sigma-70 factor (ECF subfamily)